MNALSLEKLKCTTHKFLVLSSSFKVGMHAAAAPSPSIPVEGKQIPGGSSIAKVGWDAMNSIFSGFSPGLTPKAEDLPSGNSRPIFLCWSSVFSTELFFSGVRSFNN